MAIVEGDELVEVLTGDLVFVPLKLDVADDFIGIGETGEVVIVVEGSEVVKVGSIFLIRAQILDW